MNPAEEYAVLSEIRERVRVQIQTLDAQGYLPRAGEERRRLIDFMVAAEMADRGVAVGSA